MPHKVSCAASPANHTAFCTGSIRIRRAPWPPGAAASVDRKLIAGVNVFDVYEGAGIEPGKKSIAIAVTIQPREKTMTDAEIESLADKIVAEVARRTAGALRS